MKNLLLNGLVIMSLLLLLASCQKTPKQNTVESIVPSIDFSAIKMILDSVHIEDQKYRNEIEDIERKFGWKSEEMKTHWKKIGKTDSINLVIVKDILDKYGWLGEEEIGKTANSTLFLVIQHSDQETQETYLPIMKEAVRVGKARPQSLALLEDRVGLGKGELQVYGSQIGTDQETGELYVLPLIDPDKVNARRASVGLGTIEAYISFWDLEWNVEAYKKQLPTWIKKLKEEKK